MRTTLATLATILLALTACSTDDNPAEAEPTTVEQTTSERATPAPTPSPTPTKEREPLELADGGPNPAFGPGIDNQKVCDEILTGDGQGIIERIPDTLLALNDSAPGAQEGMISMFNEFQILIQQTDGPLRAALLDLRSPFKEFYDAVNDNAGSVNLDTSTVMADAGSVMEACINVG